MTGPYRPRLLTDEGKIPSKHGYKFSPVFIYNTYNIECLYIYILIVLHRNNGLRLDLCIGDSKLNPLMQYKL